VKILSVQAELTKKKKFKTVSHRAALGLFSKAQNRRLETEKEKFERQMEEEKALSKQLEQQLKDLDYEMDDLRIEITQIESQTEQMRSSQVSKTTEFVQLPLSSEKHSSFLLCLLLSW